MKSRIFVRKLLSQAIILTFYERNAITSAAFAIWLSARDRPSDGKSFLVFTYIRQEDVAKIPYIAGGNAQCKSGPGITCLVSVTIYFTNDSPR